MQSNNPNIDDNLEHQEVFHGKYAVSIGTSLAMETLFGINDLIPPTNPLPFTRYGYVIINVRTLIRNIYGAQDVKIAVTGVGNADKAAVARMLPRIAQIPQRAGKVLDDELDAIAVAIAGISHLRHTVGGLASRCESAK